MHAVVNRITLREPLDHAALGSAQQDLSAMAVRIAGLAAIHVVDAGDGGLFVIVLADDEAAIERTRTELGNGWISEHVIPLAAGPPERNVGAVVVAYERSPAA